jgi:TrmH family RNA methyltransferase
MKSIKSRDNPFYKELSRLAGSARQRNKSKQSLLDGAHLLAAYLDSGYRPRHILLNAAASNDKEISGLLQVKDVPVTQLDDKLFAGLSELKSPSGIISLIDIPQPAGAIVDASFSLFLEDIQDPGNLGSMLRSAAAAGCDAALLSAGCADAWSPKVLRAAMGGHFVLRIYGQQDLAKAAKSFRGALLAASLNAAHNLYDCDLRGNVAFLVGNEGAGLSASLSKLATLQVTIPMPGRVESLNAAAATSICLFEAVRQRRGT